jgi:hypothetical protein
VDVCHAVLVYCALSEFRILEERWLVRNSDGLCWSTLNRFQYRGWKASRFISSRGEGCGAPHDSLQRLVTRCSCREMPGCEAGREAKIHSVLRPDCGGKTCAFA